MSRPAARAMHSLQGRQMRVRAAATVTAAVAAMEVVVPVVVRGRRMRPPVSFLLSRAGTPYARASFFHPLSSSSEHSAEPLIDGIFCLWHSSATITIWWWKKFLKGVVSLTCEYLKLISVLLIVVCE
ncbi:Protein FAR1-RELATED SEQUENCE 5 [Zea mays]|uniref:Protein FAR1-RELATED SEQUENCE 5 n=1 Tax=Zea mays TaxID=4577 RepID=A0A1D6MZR0_MAIZE|nr:Protein FAR1-RELATED SEQUENCE 5 [Zea mays]